VAFNPSNTTIEIDLKSNLYIHINLIFLQIYIFTMKYFLIDGFLHGLILPIVLEGVLQLPIYNNASDVDVESNTESDVESKKPLDPIIGLPSNLYNLSF
jgi:hypothetical protein